MADPRRNPARWLLALAALLGAVVVAVFTLQGGGGAADVVSAGDAAAAPPPPETALAAGDAVAARATALEGVAAPVGIEVRAGVRLSGPGRLEGRVLLRASTADGAAAPDPTGVEGARVELYTLPPTGKDMLARIYRSAKFAPNWQRKLEPVATVASGPGGAFAFHGVRVSTYFLEARGAAETPEQAVLVRVDRDGAGGPVDVWVRPGGRVVGTVVGAAGRPARGALVELYTGLTGVLNAMRTGDFRIFNARTDADGAFAIAGVPPGEGYFVTASGAGLALTHAGPLAVVAGADTGVEVRGSAGAAVRGKVLARHVDERGEERLVPVSGAHVGALPRGLWDQGFAAEVLAQTHAVTGPDGAYVMHRVPAGEIDVAAAAAGMLPNRGVPVIAVEGAETAAEPVVLAGGPQVTLRFHDTDGAPVPDVQASWFVTAFEDLPFETTFSPLLLQAVEGFEYPVSDADGVAVAGPFPGTPPHTIFCWRTGYGFREVRWSPDTDGDEVDVLMSSGGAVEGIVMDADRAEPVRRFRIDSGRLLDWEPDGPLTVNPYSGGRWIEDENGRFRLDAVGDWDTRMTFSAPGYLSEEVEVPVTPGETTLGIIVKLRRGGTVRGRVLDAAGEPIAGAQVAAMDERGRPIAGRMRNPRGSVDSAREEMGQEIAMLSMELFSGLGVLGAGFAVSGADGGYELTGLPAGPVVLHAAHRDYADGRTGVLHVAAGDPIEGADVVLTRGGGIYGTIRDRFGNPVPDAFLLAVSTEKMANTEPSARWVHQAAAGAEGEYHVEHLEAGGYLLACMRGDSALHLASFLGTLNFDLVTVPPDAMVRRDLVDSSAAAVRVFGVVRADGAQVGGGGIFALGFESENVLGLDVKIAQVRADGSYEFAGLAPGDYTFSYQAAGPPVRIDVEVPDAPEHRLDLALPSGRVEGIVVDAGTGEPIQNAEAVLVRGDELPGGGLIAALVQREGRADRDWTTRAGRFAFPRLQAGTYELRVGAPRWGPDRGAWAPAEPRTVEVFDQGPPTEVEVRLAPALSLFGRVVDGSGTPVHGARVYAFSHDGGEVRPATARAGEDGAFRLLGLAPGSYDVSATADGYADTAPREVEVVAGTTSEVQMELVRGVEVLVVVRNELGEPVQGATGRLVPLTKSARTPAPRLDHAIEDIFRGRGLSSAEGVLRLGNHAPGRYRLEVGRGALRADREPIELEEGPPLELEVVLE